jgi:hypothetical protein
VFTEERSAADAESSRKKNGLGGRRRAVCSSAHSLSFSQKKNLAVVLGRESHYVSFGTALRAVMSSRSSKQNHLAEA